MNWILPAIIEGYRTLKDKTIKVSIETQELTPDQQRSLFSSINKFGFLAFKEEAFNDAEQEILNSMDTDYQDTKKSPSQRLRGVLYRKWEQDTEGYEDFNRYYDFKMEKLISYFKKDLP